MDDQKEQGEQELPVEEIVHDILSRQLSEEQYREKHAKFCKYYPYLANAVFNKDFDYATFKYMMQQKSKMSQNKLSEHDASVKVGTHLVDKFVKPQLKTD